MKNIFKLEVFMDPAAGRIVTGLRSVRAGEPRA
jgi:hypothetical protein